MSNPDLRLLVQLYEWAFFLVVYVKLSDCCWVQQLQDLVSQILSDFFRIETFMAPGIDVVCTLELGQCASGTYIRIVCMKRIVYHDFAIENQ